MFIKFTLFLLNKNSVFYVFGRNSVKNLRYLYKKINIYKLLILFGSEIIQYSSFVLLCHGFRMISFIKQTLINKSLLRR
jgi:hypothetical protein